MSPIDFCEHLAIYVSTSCCIYEELSPDGVRKGKNNKVVLQLPKISTEGCFSTVFSAGQPTYCKAHKKNFFSKLFNRFRSTQANHTKFEACFWLLLFFRKMLWYPDFDKKCSCLLSHLPLHQNSCFNPIIEPPIWLSQSSYIRVNLILWNISDSWWSERLNISWGGGD